MERVEICSGIQKIVRGVDITKMNIFDADEPGYGRNVIQLTCNEGKKYTNPHDNLEYDMPDQVLARSCLVLVWTRPNLDCDATFFTLLRIKSLS